MLPTTAWTYVFPLILPATGAQSRVTQMTMPGDIFFGSIVSYFGASLVLAVDFGTVPESRVDVRDVYIVIVLLLTG